MNSEPKRVSLTEDLTPFDIPGFVAPGGALLLAVFLFEFWSRKILPSGTESESTALDEMQQCTTRWSSQPILWVMLLLF